MPRFFSQSLKFQCMFWLGLATSGCIATQGIAPQQQTLHASDLDSGDAIAQAAKEAGWPSFQWWRDYGDEQLDQWLELALKDSPSLAIASARVRQAKAMAGIAESAESLRIDGNASIKRHHWPADPFYGPGDLSDKSTWDNNSALGLSYPLDMWGRDSSRTEEMLDSAHMSAAQARQAQLELQNNVLRAYIQFSLNFAQLDIAHEVFAQQSQILELAQRRLEGGIGTHFEISQAQTPLAESQRQIDSLEEAIALSRNQLAMLAGKGPGAGAALHRPVLSLQRAMTLPSVLPSELIGHRPDVVASRWRVSANARGVDVAHAAFYPNVDLVGGLGYIASGGGILEFFARRKINYNAGAAISLPIFDGGRLRSELGEASAGYDVAVAHYNQTLINALTDISDQLVRRASMDRQQVFVAQSVASAKRSYDIAITAYARGLTDYLNVLNAQTALFHQEKIQQKIQAERLTVHAALVVALGGGVNTPVDSPAEQTLNPRKPGPVLRGLDQWMSRP
ncbi:efflux transporter outer membrane subunit [Pseudomonas sp. NPDC085632]|uniref:efflux transporter outer membrane subunit n=1 Tax=Pseudomonas sp. NPDC085632 TaxID=3364429 RepID=UPI0037C926E1